MVKPKVEAQSDFDPEAPIASGPAREKGGDIGVLDLSGVDENAQQEALPPGTYNCIVDDSEFVYSQSNNNPMISWRFKVLHPDYENRILFTHNVLNNEYGIARLKRMLVRLVPDREDLIKAFKPKEDHAQLVGRPCRVKVKMQTYEGQQRNRVTDILPPADESSETFLDS